MDSIIVLSHIAEQLANAFMLRWIWRKTVHKKTLKRHTKGFVIIIIVSL